MKESKVKEILVRNGISFIQHATIYGTLKADMGAYKNGLGNMMHTMKDHILHFNGKEVVILAIDDMNGMPKGKTLVRISKEQIKSINIKIRLLIFWMIIHTEKGDIQYKIRKSILGSPWHKENLSYLLLGASQMEGE